MQSSAWVELLNMIPAELQGQLLLMTSAGNEINIQAVIRAEKEYGIFRGRYSGSTEGGSVLIIPYAQIVCLGFRDSIKESQAMAMFGGSGVPGQTTVPEEKPALSPAVPSVLPPKGGEPKTPPSGVRPAASAKTALLERLRRSRLGGGDTPGLPQK